MKLYGLISLFFTSLLTSCFAIASFIDPVDGKFDMGEHRTEPAVGYGGGVAGLFLHESDEEK